ncbi:hypothetical protein Hanom_Chr10g00873791 [Helianthus anomalus]
MALLRIRTSYKVTQRHSFSMLTLLVPSHSYFSHLARMVPPNQHLALLGLGTRVNKSLDTILRGVTIKSCQKR